MQSTATLQHDGDIASALLIPWEASIALRRSGQQGSGGGEQIRTHRHIPSGLFPKDYIQHLTILD